MKKRKRLHLFEGYGIELEYMIVDQETLDVLPVADKLLFDFSGNYSGDFENGPVTWSNEMALHVIELKCTTPQKDLVALELHFKENIELINEGLKKYGGVLMPSAAHPWMNPAKDTVLWPHGNSEIYELYDKIFNCNHHGWSNLQSTHINLPFYDDEEFCRLHTAIRLILPLIPGIAASSPIIEGEDTGMSDVRMRYYGSNQKRIPSITGKIIPESILSEHQYRKQIYARISRDIKDHDPENILQPVWVNSRGAIARFDRGSIEIRVMDIQESPKGDLAIIALIIEVLKLFRKEKLSLFDLQYKVKTDVLTDILQQGIRLGEKGIIMDKSYLQAIGYTGPNESPSIKETWQFLLQKVEKQDPEALKHWRETLEQLLSKGCLSHRIMEGLENDFSHLKLQSVYRNLSVKLSENSIYG